MAEPARDRFFQLLRSTVRDGALVKLTLGKARGADATLKNIFVRPVALKSGPHLAFVRRHDTRDITKNYPPAEALGEIEKLLGADFLDAHLFTTTQTAQLECQPDGSARLKIVGPALAAGPSRHARDNRDGLPTSGSPTHSPAHDRAKQHLIPASSRWLHALGVTNDQGRPREGMADKFSQIQKFAELLTHLLADAGLPANRPVQIVDMGAGKGYLTFAVAALLGNRAVVRGIDARAELVEFCNRIAQENDLPNLSFGAGRIVDAPLDAIDVLIALHACDTATDDALARGISAGAKLLVVSPCCQKELRPQLMPPPVLADALRHGIFQERAAEFVTDSLRASLLEWAGYRTKVFEFISTEHTAKNLMIAATKSRESNDAAIAQRMRAFAQFYGIHTQRLAAHLGFRFDP